MTGNSVNCFSFESLSMKMLDIKNERSIDSSTTTDELWGRFLSGDKDALGLIYRAYTGFLYDYGMHFCQDEERVKDCVQDLFSDLWNKREHLTAKVISIRYYLLSSLRRRLLRGLQKERQHRANQLPDEFDFELVPPRENNIINAEILQEQKSKLHQAMQHLTRRQREVIYLRFYQSLSYEQIEHITKLRRESVYNVIYSSLILLKKLLITISPLLLSV